MLHGDRCRPLRREAYETSLGKAKAVQQSRVLEVQYGSLEANLEALLEQKHKELMGRFEELLRRNSRTQAKQYRMLLIDGGAALKRSLAAEVVCSSDEIRRWDRTYGSSGTGVRACWQKCNSASVLQ